MITVYLGKVSKRPNSTKVPEVSTLTPETGELNQDFLLTAPQILFDLDPQKAPEYNYAYIPSFNRYYFITSWNFVTSLWMASLTVDVLATYKKNIGNEKLYVLRSSSNYNEYIPDEKYPALADRTNIVQYHDNMFTSYLAGGCYVVGIVNKSTGTGDSRMGAVQYYVMTPARMEELVHQMFANVNYLDVDTDELSKELQAMLINPFQYVVSAMWFPFQISTWTTVINIPVGWWALKNVNGYLFNSPYSTFSTTVNVPKHPQQNSRGKWVNLSPYTTYSLEFWPFGLMPLDSSKLVDVETLTLEVRVDHISGVGTLRVTSESGSIITSSTAQIGVPLQLAQLSVDYGRLQGTSGVLVTAAGSGLLTYTDQTETKEITLGSMWQGVKTAASNLAGLVTGSKSLSGTLGDVAQGVIKQAAGIGNAANSVLADLEVSGGNGGRAAFSYGIYLHMHYSKLTDADNDHDGRPLCKLVKISTLSGFVMCKSGDIEISSATLNEQKLVEAYLEGGFFYE